MNRYLIVFFTVLSAQFTGCSKALTLTSANPPAGAYTSIPTSVELTYATDPSEEVSQGQNFSVYMTDGEPTFSTLSVRGTCTTAPTLSVDPSYSVVPNRGNKIKFNLTGGTCAVGQYLELHWHVHGIQFLANNNPTYWIAGDFDVHGDLVYSVVAATTISCPTGYVRVPKNTAYTTSDFCVAKYTASGTTGAAQSVAGATPWVSINRADAAAACAANGTGYDLMTNAEWQTIARNIEAVASNWSSGTVGNGSINSGHSDGTPNNTLAASATDSDACSGTGETCSDTVWDLQRRTFKLSTNDVIWDFAGNAWQWMKDTNATAFGADAYMQAVTNVTHSTSGTVGTVTGTAKTLFGPAGDYTALNASPFGGLGRGYLNSATGGISRGGSYPNGTDDGIFAVILDNAATFTSVRYGFRCVYHP